MLFLSVLLSDADQFSSNFTIKLGTKLLIKLSLKHVKQSFACEICVNFM